MNNTSQEFETKILNIDVQEIEKKLKALKSIETPEFLAKRYVYDLSSDNIEWIRLRDSNGKTTLTYKYKVKGNTAIGKTIEIETEVVDFEKMAAILSKIPFKKYFYQENKNHIFKLNDIEFSIDTWPHIPAYLEIESTNTQKVQEGLRLLGLDGQDVGDKDIKEIYAENGINLHAYKELKFDA